MEILNLEKMDIKELEKLSNKCWEDFFQTINKLFHNTEKILDDMNQQAVSLSKEIGEIINLKEGIEEKIKESGLLNQEIKEKLRQCQLIEERIREKDEEMRKKREGELMKAMPMAYKLLKERGRVFQNLQKN